MSVNLNIGSPTGMTTAVLYCKLYVSAHPVTLGVKDAMGDVTAVGPVMVQVRETAGAVPLTVAVAQALVTDIVKGDVADQPFVRVPLTVKEQVSIVAIPAHVNVLVAALKTINAYVGVHVYV